MENTFLNGAIIAKAKYYENVNYNVSNQSLSVVFDGKGDISYYAHDYGDFYVQEGINIWVNGIPMDISVDKTVKMIGKKQSIEIDLGSGTLVMEQFLDQKSDGVYFLYTLNTKVNDLKVEICMFWPALNNISANVFGDFEIINEDESIFFRLNKNQNVVKFFASFDKERPFSENDFDVGYAEIVNEIKSVKVPDNLTEEQKAMFYSCYFCALENYKEKGEFKGFMAGHHYLFPMRTYYRDSYYTILPMYNGNTDKIRNQIITLAKGVFEDGFCPSAVFTDYTGYWADHFDSPSFFAIMLCDYVKFTGDKAILDEIIKDKSVLTLAETVINKLSEKEDCTGLIYKEGKFNKRDWADAVNRYGYVTYDEILYARANWSLSKLFADKDVKKSQYYADKYEKTKNSINEQLWDENLGYYVNFKNEEYVEDNLSIDTVWSAIFGIADDKRARRMLENMENLLEARNNAQVKVPDFGVMTVWPFYKNVTAGIFRSAQPYNYHNGANWPYWSAIYAYAKRKFGMEYNYALESWFTYNLKRGNYTPIEYFSSACKDGSLLQAWSGAAAFVLDEKTSMKFFD